MRHYTDLLFLLFLNYREHTVTETKGQLVYTEIGKQNESLIAKVTCITRDTCCACILHHCTLRVWYFHRTSWYQIPNLKITIIAYDIVYSYYDMRKHAFYSILAFYHNKHEVESVEFTLRQVACIWQYKWFQWNDTSTLWFLLLTASAPLL
jgi:hypothetical protein